MHQPSFLDRTTLGLPNYLAIALLVVLAIAFIPRGARRALESNTNNAEDWLPDSYSESIDLKWFRQHFGHQSFVLVSWEDCTLDNDSQLRLLAKKLERAPLTPAVAKAAKIAPHPDRRLFSRVVTGPELIEQLTRPPSQLDRAEAIARLDGAMVGPQKVAGDDGSRTTCLIAYLSPFSYSTNLAMRGAIERLQEIAVTECGLKLEELHMGGPPADNITIDIEGEKTLLRLAGLSGIVGLVLSYLCFRNWRLTGVVLATAILSAGASLAFVFYYGVIEVFGWGASAPRLGRVDAILMSMPAVVYVLALSGAIHLVNYYRDARRDGGRHGAVERMVRMAWSPCAIAALTTAIGLASLATSDILPIEKFGVFSAVGVLLTVALLFTLIPVALHRFPPAESAIPDHPTNDTLPPWATRAAESLCRNYRLYIGGCISLMLLLALGLPQIYTSVKVLKLLDPQTKLIKDYTWLEEHLGNLVPMEVVLTIPAELRRAPSEHPERPGGHYAMTTFERMVLAQRVGDRIEALPPVGSVLDAATFGPTDYHTTSPANRRTHDTIVSRAIDENRGELSDYLLLETPASGAAPGETRELWRASARIAALADIDYGEFVGELELAINPVIAAYRNRDRLLSALQTQDKSLVASKICLVTADEPTEDDGLYYTLLRESGVPLRYQGRKGSLWPITISQATFSPPDAHLEDASHHDKSVERIHQQMAQFDAVVTTDPKVAVQLREMAIEGVHLVDLSQPSESDVKQIDAVCTGMVPVVYKTQRQLLVSLQQSLGMATVLIAFVLMIQMRSIPAGLLAMIPNVFPIVMVFGTLGWLGISVDIGIMMTASVALGVAVDDTVHFLSWFRRGLGAGCSRREATMVAYKQCGTAMVQTTMVAGLGLAVFATSTFTPTQQFGWLMITILCAALIGDLIFLPALLVSPLGRFVPPAAPAEGMPIESRSNLVDESNTSNVPQAVEPTEEPPLEEVPPTQTEASLRHDSPRYSDVMGIEENLSPPHAALRDKLRALRRDDR